MGVYGVRRGDSDAGFRCGPGHENFSEKFLKLFLTWKKFREKNCERSRNFLLMSHKSHKIFLLMVWGSHEIFPKRGRTFRD